MIKVLIEAPILTQSGYGEHARLVFRSLVKQKGIELYVNPLRWGNTSWSASIPADLREKIEKSIQKFRVYLSRMQQTNQKAVFDTQIHVGLPSEFEKKAIYSVCVTAGIETDRVSPEWLIRTHKGMNKLVVPSEHSKLGFTETSYEMLNKETNSKTIVPCNVPVDVVPYPVKNVKPVDLDFKTSTDFNFLSIALLGPRKNLENMIKWFVEEFRSENVGLILKTGRSSGSPLDAKFTISHLDKVLSPYKDRKCKVYLVHGDLEESEIHSLYLRDDVKAYISTTHGEGYGLPIFEAAYSGLPIVATDWSAHLDFLTAPYKEGGKIKDKKLFARVKYNLGDIPKEVVWKDILIEGSKWAYPEESSFKTQIRNVYKNYGMYKKWSLSLMKNILETHNASKIEQSMRKSILLSKETVAPCNPQGISFCISTNASKVDKTKLEINSIKNTMSKTDLPYEIIIAGVTNEFAELEGLTLVETPEDANNGLLAKLRNNAAEVSKYDTIVFVDDDFIFDENWASKFIEYSKSSGWQVLGNKILLPDGSRFWDRCTINPHKLVDYDYPDLCGKIYQTGGFWIMRRETYLEHKWDSSIPINAAERGLATHNEDIDMTIRIHNAGIEFCFDKDNLVWHNDDSYMEFNEQTLKKEIVNKHLGIEQSSEPFEHPAFSEAVQKCN